MKGVFRWLKRAFLGGKSETLVGAEDGEIESPRKLLKEAFFRKKTAVVALVFLIALFSFVFIAPSVVPLDINYTDPLQQNVPPGYGLKRVPKGLKKEIEEINGFSDFTVGLSKSGEVFVWGNGNARLQGVDLREIPQEVQAEGAAFVAAGKDHCIAITKGGKLVGWGDKSCGQYGFEPLLNTIPTSKALGRGILPREVRQLTCGYQTTALVTRGGVCYLWGNTNAVVNLAAMQDEADIQKVVFTNSVAVALKTDGSIFTGGGEYFRAAVSSKNGRQNALSAYMVGRKAIEIAANGKCIALVTDEGELIVSGAFENGEDILPILQEGEYFTNIVGGTRHFSGITNLGRVYAWGHDAYGQCGLRGRTEKGGRVYAGSLQTYLVSEEGKLVKSVGLGGYLMGTDGRGRDVFSRIAHGGKMTMTIGGVAVLVSSIIAVLVGCVSGYFGGWVDTLLMRVTEIFSSIPFLPFAMLLSQIIKNYNVSEGMRIFIIMLILGALSWTGLARMIRGQVLAEREKEFVVAARAMGVKEGKIAFRHVLPNVVSVILVSVTLDFAGCLLTESSLSYLGFGVQQPRPTWGNMLSGSNNSTIIQHYWWQWLFPALFLSLAVVCINVVGDALRDALDPKNKER